MPLMEPDPPTTRPRGCGIRRPLRCACGTVSKRQFRRGVAIAAATSAGVLISGCPIAPPGLEHADPHFRVLRQATRKHATGRARTDDDVVKGARGGHRASTGRRRVRCPRAAASAIRLSIVVMRPVMSPTKLMSRSGSTQKIVVPAPCAPKVPGEPRVPNMRGAHLRAAYRKSQPEIRRRSDAAGRADGIGVELVGLVAGPDRACALDQCARDDAAARPGSHRRAASRQSASCRPRSTRTRPRASRPPPPRRRRWDPGCCVPNG